MSGPRVAMLIDHLAGGGAERFVVDLAGALAERGADVTVCVSRAGADADALALLAGRRVASLALERSRRLQPARWRPLVALLRSGRVDVLNTHLHSSNVYGAALSLASGVPLVATEHGSTADGRALRSALDRALVARRARVVVATSEHTRERLLRRGYRAAAVRVIRPAPGDSGAVSTRAAARGALGLSLDGPPVVGTVCALRREKRLDVLLEAAAAVAARRPLRVAVVGDGPERAAAEETARRLRVDATFCGWHPDAAAVLPALDVFALSSDTEGTPLALIEAMRAGVPVVATAVGGVPAAAPDGDCALLVPRREPAALAAALERLLDDPALASRLARRARAHARAHHSLQRAADAWFDLLRAVARPRCASEGASA
jgi:glycosyltransferase involved in cell wall biosynthesis